MISTPVGLEQELSVHDTCKFEKFLVNHLDHHHLRDAGGARLILRMGPDNLFRSRYSLSTSTFQASAQPSSNGFGSSLGFGPFFPGKHSVDEDEDKPKEEDRMATPDVKSYLRLTDPDDKFPTLTRRAPNSVSSLKLTSIVCTVSS